MKDMIYNYLMLIASKKRRIETKDIEKYVIDKLGLDEYWGKCGGYNSFNKVIESLVQEGVIQPVKSWKQNGKQPALYNGYQVILQEDNLDAALIQLLSTQYHPAIKVSYYFNHKSAYQEDKFYLTALNKFLQQNIALTELPAITVNERSFQIFHDEKWLLSKQGRNFLQRVGLTLEDLQCYPTYEPFFYFQRQNRSAQEVNVLIVENKDTFFSLKKLFQKGIYSWSKTSFSLLIYGEGKKIEKSFSFFWELEEYKNSNAIFYYFGDLDLEGVLIWYELQRQEWVDIKPFVFFYEALINKYLHVARPIKKEQKISEEAVQAFLTHFSTDASEAISKMLRCNLYLPQEGLNYQLLNELSD
ncbi:Wadjet anti-phage system protein JetD domain-containing protein [Desulforamulus aquiferis]|uniref:DUF2220 family protein n=1 Tax=Desulforamulus aquiferis TaxID=1397668 RepID=A0AAW7ZAY5_9FIRM|nr:Wadjet anti-phage system protein JetD domain-containing protein [Desulforamulus aquiferis]MDO7786878.1 DUF2220 family protein [Desulforamulus aquiferis]